MALFLKEPATELAWLPGPCREPCKEPMLSKDDRDRRLCSDSVGLVSLDCAAFRREDEVLPSPFRAKILSSILWRPSEPSSLSASRLVVPTFLVLLLLEKGKTRGSIRELGKGVSISPLVAESSTTSVSALLPFNRCRKRYPKTTKDANESLRFSLSAYQGTKFYLQRPANIPAPSDFPWME